MSLSRRGTKQICHVSDAYKGYVIRYEILIKIQESLFRLLFLSVS
jgi:hypothetical protein